MSILTLTQVKTYLGVTSSSDDALLTQFIAAAEELVERWCDTKLAEASLLEDCDGGGLCLRPTWAPVTSVTQITDNDTDAVVSADSYQLRDNGIARNDQSRWDSGGGRFRVDYDAGYSVAPAGLIAVLYEIIAHLYRERSSGGMKSESLGDYAWTRAEEFELRDRFAPRLAAFRKVGV